MFSASIVCCDRASTGRLQDMVILRFKEQSVGPTDQLFAVSAQLSLYPPKERLKERSASPFGGDSRTKPKIVNYDIVKKRESSLS